VEVLEGAGDLQRRRQDDVHVGLALEHGPLAAEGALVDGRLRSPDHGRLSVEVSQLGMDSTVRTACGLTSGASEAEHRFISDCSQH